MSDPVSESERPVVVERVGYGAMLRLLRDGRPKSRSELAARSGTTRAIVNQRLGGLVASGLVTQETERSPTGGRPAVGFRIGSNTSVILTADLGATHATVGISDLTARVIVDRELELSIDSGPEAVLDKLRGHWSELLEQAGRSHLRVAGVGIGLPGPVEAATGRPVKPPIMPGWDDFAVPEYLADFSAHVLVDNDANLMAIGEHAIYWPRKANILLVKVGTGIGCGIIANGQILHGDLGAAGDIGHIHVSGSTALCRCGNRGCLEAEAGGGAIIERLRNQGLDLQDPRELLSAVRQGVPAAADAIREAGRILGDVLSTVVSLLNPSILVIAGDLALAEDQLFAGVREMVYARSLPLATRRLSIVPSRLGRQAGIVGAAVMARDAALNEAYVDQFVDDHVNRGLSGG